MISLLSIATIFIISSWISYQQLSKNIIKNELNNQQQISQIIAQSLDRYFNTLKVIVRIAASNQELSADITKYEENILHQNITSKLAKEILSREGIYTILSNPVHAAIIPSNEANIILANKIKNWQLYKGLPNKDFSGRTLAKGKRSLALNILHNYSDIRYLFYAKANGDIIFIEPFSIQKNIKAYNYAFRDALKLVNHNKTTSISEAYISNELYGTQSVTVATPIFDTAQNVKYIFGASISAKTLKDRVFAPLQSKMGLNDTHIYLLDRHAHVIASSSGNNIYYPLSDKTDDNYDPGNLRKSKIFRSLKWYVTYFEKGTSLNRKTLSWDISSIKHFYHMQYTNDHGVKVITTFLPLSLDNRSVNWGILVETPLSQLLVSEMYLKKLLLIFGGLLSVVLSSILILSLRYFSKLETEIQEKEQEINKMATQVAHDIKSPLVALDILLENLQSIDEKIRVMVHKSINRINDIANNLLFYSKSNTEDITDKLLVNNEMSESLYLALDNIIAEKRYEYHKSGVNIQLVVSDNAYHCFSDMNLASFKRALSNLINNSIEATNYNGSVVVTLACNHSDIFICIEDNGCGIPLSLLHKVSEPGFSFNKKNGNGYGLYYAKEYIESIKGKFHIHSTENIGSKISIILPRSHYPEWFCDVININTTTKIIVIDDDPSIHDAWNKRFNTFPDVLTTHFTKLSEFIKYKQKNQENTIFLIDYELLSEDKSGLDVVEELSLSNQSILVTSYYEVSDVRARCQKLGLKIIPKSFVPHIIIKNSDNPKDPAIILIDDDEMIRAAWTLAATSSGTPLSTFASSDEFHQVINNYTKQTLIYIDSDLGNSKKGELYAKELYDLGYTEIYLATGHSRDLFEKIWWIKSIVGKEPPFLN